MTWIVAGQVSHELPPNERKAIPCRYFLAFSKEKAPEPLLPCSFLMKISAQRITTIFVRLTGHHMQITPMLRHTGSGTTGVEGVLQPVNPQHRSPTGQRPGCRIKKHPA